jgi:hypothetical protein
LFQKYFSTFTSITMQIKFAKNNIAMYETYTLARFEPTFFCSFGVADDHYTTPSGHKVFCTTLIVNICL